MRALILLAALLLASFGANAQTYCGLDTWLGAVNNAGPGITYGTREEAQAACESVAQITADPTSGGWFARVQRQSCKLNESQKTFTINANVINSSITSNCGTTYAASGTRTASGWKFTGETCPAGSTWNQSLNKCFNPQECLQRNASLSSDPTVRNFAQACIAGCTLKSTGPTVGVDGLFTGVYQYSGDACTANPPSLPDKPPEDATKRPNQECTPASGGMTFCLKPDGQHCYTSSNGKQNCWGPGETGVKTDGPVAQKRDAGPQATPPTNLQLPSGDNLQQSTSPKTQTTTITNNNTTTTVTTTTTNYTTQHGTNAGTKNEGESNTGDGTGKDNDDQDGTATGGGDCKTPPVVTGDQVLGMVATQAWHTRCAVEAGNAAKVTGDVGDCKQPFTVEGTHANAVQLRAMRAQICNGDKDGDGQPDWTKPDGTEAGEGGEDEEPGMLARMVNTDMLDTGGFLGGGGQCPQLGTIEFGPFGEFNLDSQPYFCDLIALMRGVVLLMGVFLSLRILTGDVL